MKLLVLLTLLFSLTIQTYADSLWQKVLKQDLSQDQFGLSGYKANNKINLIITEEKLEEKKNAGLRVQQPSWFGLKLEGAFNQSEFMSSRIKNTGTSTIQLMFWVVGSNGWGASGVTQEIKPNEILEIKVPLRATYPDSTPKINPNKLKSIRWMIPQAKAGQSIEITNLKAEGSIKPFDAAQDLLDVPEMTGEEPAAGKRVRYQLTKDLNTEKYISLYLPKDWSKDKSYPVIFEFPDNIFYKPQVCYSIGRPEDCVIGYGISKGQGSIWVSLPFIENNIQGVAMNGFGSNAGKDTIQYTLEVIEDICKKFGGDHESLFLCGFSRGSIAAGYIGLNNDKIASHWKGIIGCQHYDGSRWNQSRMSEAAERAKRFKGLSIFQIDNSREKYAPVVQSTPSHVSWYWEKSNLEYHSTTMFLDNRLLMLKLRPWYQRLLKRSSSKK